MNGYISLCSKMDDRGLKVAALTKETIDHFIKSGIYNDSDISLVVKNGKTKITVEVSEDFSYTLDKR